VIAQIGFTRFESSVFDVNGELALNVERAALARELSWVPAVENRGDGIFVALKPGAVDKWLGRASVKTRGEQLIAGFKARAKTHSGAATGFAVERFMVALR
jgi:hypothetical protein